MDRYFDWRILAGVMALALGTAVIAVVMTVRRRRRHRPKPDYRLGISGAEETQQSLTRMAEQLARQAPARPPVCTCGYRPEGIERDGVRSYRYHVRGICPAWTKEGAEEFMKLRWKTERGAFDPTPPRPLPPATWRDPGPELDLMEAAAASSREPEQLVVMAAHPGEHPVFLGGGGEFGGAGATGDFDPPTLPRHTIAPTLPDLGAVDLEIRVQVSAPRHDFNWSAAAEPAAACEPAPAADTSSSYDPGAGSSGGDL